MIRLRINGTDLFYDSDFDCTGECGIPGQVHYAVISRAEAQGRRV